MYAIRSYYAFDPRGHNAKARGQSSTLHPDLSAHLDFAPRSTRGPDPSFGLVLSSGRIVLGPRSSTGVLRIRFAVNLTLL